MSKKHEELDALLRLVKKCGCVRRLGWLCPACMQKQQTAERWMLRKLRVA